MSNEKKYLGQIEFDALVSNVRTSPGGGIKVTLHIFEVEVDAASRLILLNEKNVQVAVVPLPEN